MDKYNHNICEYFWSQKYFSCKNRDVKTSQNEINLSVLQSIMNIIVILLFDIYLFFFFFFNRCGFGHLKKVDGSVT